MAKDPIRPADDEARALATTLIRNARFGSLAVLQDGQPMVSRVAVGTDESGAPLMLVSDLSLHTKALRSDARCSLLLGEPEDKGDPLTHPRITLQATAVFIPKSEVLIARYLRHQPKAKLYIGFADFNFVRLAVSEAHLNGGFGKAYYLTSRDLLP